jgi:hypothetical protein
VPEPVQRVLLKALAKDRLDRYTSTEELMTAFKEAWTEAGVPMQGTAIIMRSTALKNNVSPKEPVTPEAKTTPASPPTKKRSPWMWVSIGLIVLLCFAVAFLAVRRNRTAPESQPTAAATLTIRTQVPPTSPLPKTGTLPPSTVEATSLEITAAMEMVAKNPKDPDAHLGLSLALMDAKQIRPAMEELVTAANLAGPNNKEFLEKAADKFAMRGYWVAAANMYLRLVPMYQNKELPKNVGNKLNEAVYKSAEQKDMPLFVTFERVDSADPALGYIARGRHTLYNGRIEDAKAQLENAQKEKPYMYEVYLFRAEIDMKIGDQAEAKKILLSISSAPEASEWIRIMAENYLKNIK